MWSTAIVLMTMIFGGQVWTEASTKAPAYAKFIGAYNKWLASKNESESDLRPTEADHPRSCGPCFQFLPKPAIRVLLLKMLHPDPMRRATIHEILNGRWVRMIECCCEETEDVRGRGNSNLAPGARGREDSTGSENSGNGEAGADKEEFDASKRCKKMKVVKYHNHLPPKQHRLPQHKFDMGDGYQ